MKLPTPEQFTWLRHMADNGHTEHQMLLWLHERLAALEDAPQPQATEPPAHTPVAVAANTEPHLVDLMDKAYANGNGTYAEISAVADWLKERGYGSAAASLRQEADR